MSASFKHPIYVPRSWKKKKRPLSIIRHFLKMESAYKLWRHLDIYPRSGCFSLVIWLLSASGCRIHFAGAHHVALEKGMATHSSILAWRIPWTAEPDGLQSMGSHRVGHDWSNLVPCCPGKLTSLSRLLQSGPHCITLIMASTNLLHGRKAMTNLNSMLKSRGITLPTKVHIVKAIVFPLVMCGCESWTIKKAEYHRIDAFELWCRWRLLRVPWTARRSNQSILKKVNPEYSLEELMLKLKLQFFGHLIQRANSFEKTLMLGKIEDRRRGWWWRMSWLDGLTASMDMSLSRLWEMVKDMGSQRAGHDWVNNNNNQTSGLPSWSGGKKSACKCRKCEFYSWVRKIPWRRKWQPTPVFLPRKSHGQRSLVGHSVWGCKRVKHNLATKQQQPDNNR